MGDVVANRYAIAGNLGAGAMGEVYKAEDSVLGKTIAIKILNAGFAADPRALSRLRSEVALAHRVTHPNVCRIYDIGVDQRTAFPPRAEPLPFLTMEYLDGQTLSSFVRQRGLSACEYALSVLTQLASALAAAHAVGVIHRDLKGDNVMLVRQPDGAFRAVITDFGLAGTAVAGAFATTDRAGGSSLPMRLAGEPSSPSTDVFAFGLLAYQMLNGGLPPPLGEPTGERFPDPRALSEPARLAKTSLTGWRAFLQDTLAARAAHRLRDGAEVEAALRALAPPARRKVLWRWTMASLTLGATGVAFWFLPAALTPSPQRPPVAQFADAATSGARKLPPLVPDESRRSRTPPTIVTAPMPTSLPPRIVRRAHLAPPPGAEKGASSPEPLSPLESVREPAAGADDIVRSLRWSTARLSDRGLADPFAAGSMRAPGPAQ